jgi:hypothetical protein
MAASVVGQVQGTAAVASAATVANGGGFGTAAVGDLLVFCYATEFKAFGNDDWLPNTGWEAIPSVRSGPIGAYIGMVFHSVQSGETSWTPVNDAGNSIAGAFICYRIQGHAISNPIVNYNGAANFNGVAGALFPTTAPGFNLGLMFATGGIPTGDSTALSGGVGNGGGSWTPSVQASPSLDFNLVGCWVAAVDNITPAAGQWTSGVAAQQTFQQWAVQAAPSGSGLQIKNLEIIPSDFQPVAGHISFDLDFTPTPGNILMIIAEGSGLFQGLASAPAGWSVKAQGQDANGGIFIATRTVQAGDGTSWDLGAQPSGVGTPTTWYGYVYELVGVEYVGCASGAITAPMFTTPNEPSNTGPTLCFYAPVAGQANVNTWSQYSMENQPAQTPDGCAAWSLNGTAANKFVGSVSHQTTRAGGSGSTGMPSTANGYGATIVFSLGPVPCASAPPASTPGTFFPSGVPEARLSMYNADGSVNRIEVRDDLIGGRIQHEDTPSGCGACTLNLGIPWEAMVAPSGLIANSYWIARNIVEISEWDDVIQTAITAGATKIYVGSRYGYDTAVGHDTGQIILDDGVNVTYRIPVTGVGTDGGGDYITVGAPGVYPGHPSSIPAYAAGTKIFRRRYTGIIMRRGLWNSRTPQGQVTLTGLAQYLSEAVGTFTINIDEVGDAIYQCINQFASRWPQLVISAGNFPYTAQAYSGSNQQYTLADEITQILSCGITNGDTWVVRVGHDWTVRLKRVYSQSCLAYDYNVELDQGVTAYEAQFVQGQDEDVSNFYNSIEVTGDTNPTTKQPYGAIVQDATSIALFGQVDGVPISNTSCKSDSDCALYAQALLDDNAIPRNNYQVRVATYNKIWATTPPLGLARGDCILGVHNVRITSFNSGAPNINGLCMSVVTTMDIKTCDTWQDCKFSQIEPSWNKAMAERGAKLSITLRRNVIPPVSVDSYMVGAFADQYSYGPTSLNVVNKAFQVIFGYGSGIQTIPAQTIPMHASATNYLWMKTDGTFTTTYSTDPTNSQPDQPPVPGAMLHSIFQTSATGVIGDIFRAPRGVLGNGGSGGPGSGTVTEIDQGTGIELTPDPITGAGSIAIAKAGALTLLANPTGSTAYPVPTSLSAILDAIIGTDQGDIIFRSSGVWKKLLPGTSGYVLTSQGSAADLIWAAAGGGSGGGITGYGSSFPGSPTDKELWYRTDLGATFVWLASSPGPAWFNADALAQLTDVSISGLADDDLLTYDSVSTKWINASLSALLDDVFGNTQGDVLYRGASGWAALGPGAAGQVFTTQGSGNNPGWTNAGGGGGGGGGTYYPFAIVQDNAWADTSVTVLCKFVQTAASGNTLLAIVSTDATQSVTTPTGWTLLFSGVQTNYAQLLVYRKTAAGTETQFSTLQSINGTFAIRVLELGGTHALDQQSVVLHSPSSAACNLQFPSITPASGAMVFVAAASAWNYGSIVIGSIPPQLTLPSASQWLPLNVMPLTNASRFILGGLYNAPGSGSVLASLPTASFGLYDSGTGLVMATFSIL